MRRKSAALLAVVMLAAPALAHAQTVQSGGDQSPAIVAQGGVSVTYGLSLEQVQAAIAGSAAQVAELSRKLGVTEDATGTLLRIVGEQDVPLDQLSETLHRVAD